jgi:hypothetical protein
MRKSLERDRGHFKHRLKRSTEASIRGVSEGTAASEAFYSTLAQAVRIALALLRKPDDPLGDQLGCRATTTLLILLITFLGHQITPC